MSMKLVEVVPLKPTTNMYDSFNMFNISRNAPCRNNFRPYGQKVKNYIDMLGLLN